MQTQQAVDAVGATFLGDWRGDEHRPLSDASRDKARGYIEAIVAHDTVTRGLSAEARTTVATMLWRTFRETYDDLRGPFGRTEREDVGRALNRL